MNMNKKILITTGIYPPDIGGPATMLAALAKSLEDNGFEVKILTYSDEISKDEKNIFRINRKQNSLLMYLKYFLKMWKLSGWADVIYVTDTYSVGYFAYLIKKITGKKYILRFAGDSAWEMAVGNGWTNDYIIDFQNKTYNKKIENLKERRKKIMIGAEKVIAVCKFLGELAKKIGVGKDNIKVIYNSIDFIKDKEFPKIGFKEKFGTDSKLILYSGRLVPWKGAGAVIETIPQLLEKFGNVHFLILGDGPEKENLKSQISNLKISGNVHLLGKIEHDKIAGYLKEADLFILNTNYEGMSHAIMEAMAAGVPVVTTNVGGNKELIEDDKEGSLVGYNNKEELYSAIVKILSDDNFKKTISANARKKLEKFKWTDNIGETIKVIKEVI